MSSLALREGGEVYFRKKGKSFGIQKPNTVLTPVAASWWALPGAGAANLMSSLQNGCQSPAPMEPTWAQGGSKQVP